PRRALRRRRLERYPDRRLRNAPAAGLLRPGAGGLRDGDPGSRALRHADGRSLQDVLVQPRGGQAPGARALDLPREHRGRRRRRSGAPPGRSDPGAPRKGGCRPARIAREDRPDARGARPRRFASRPARRERPSRGSGPRSARSGANESSSDGRGTSNLPMNPFSRLLRYFSRYRGRAIPAVLAMLVVAFSTVAMLFLLGKVVDETLGAGSSARLSSLPSGGAGAARTQPVMHLLDGWYAAATAFAESHGIAVYYAVPLLLLLALVSKNVFSYFSEFELNGIGVAMVRDLRRDAEARLLAQSASYYSRSTTGDLMSRMLSDVEQIQTAFGHNLTDLVQGVLTLLAVLVYVF